MTVEKFILRIPIYLCGFYSIISLSTDYKIDGLLTIFMLVFYILIVESLVSVYSVKEKPKELNNSHVMDSLHLEDHHLEAEAEDLEQQEVYTVKHEPKKPL